MSEQDARIREAFERQMCNVFIHPFSIGMNSYWKKVILEQDAEYLIQFVNKLITSCNAEIEVAYEKGKQFVENAYRSEWEVQEDEIKRLKYQLEGFKDQYNINGKLTEEIEALKAEIESMWCCGNCGNYGPLKQYKNEFDGCVRTGDAYSGGYHCDNWTRKTK